MDAARAAHAARGLQERAAGGGGGVSADSLALVATAVLGMASFIAQAQIAAKEQKQRAALDRAQGLREKEEARAAKQLERVQLAPDDNVILIPPCVYFISESPYKIYK